MDWLSSFGDWLDPGWVGASAAVAAGVAAWFAAIVARSTLNQIKRDSGERSRPQVAAELRDVPYSKGMQILVVRNFGPTIARNVSVKFTPEIPDPDPSTQSVTPFLKRRYSQPIPTLTPGMELDNLWYVGELGPDNRFVNSEPTPDQAVVEITYEDGQGRRFTESFPIDVGIIRGRTYTEGSYSPTQQVKTALKHIKSLDGSAKDLAHSARLLTAPQRQVEYQQMLDRQQKHEDLAKALGLGAAEQPSRPIGEEEGDTTT
jgi:hypothetical protein